MQTHLLLGQERVVRFLAHGMGSGRLGHALLFLGPRGVGRETAARGLACGLLCERHAEKALRPFGCGVCRGCRRVHSGSHPDVHVVMSEAEAVDRGVGEPEGKKRPSTEIKVDQVRELARALRMKAYEGGARVAIVLDAHRMNASAANALLKTLEEPASNTCLVLTAPQERSVLRTIASRCQRLFFNPLPVDVIAQILERRGLLDAAERAQRADGSVASALVVDPTDAAGVEAASVALMHTLASGSLNARMEAAEQLGRERRDVDALLSGLERRLGEGLRGAHGIGAADALPMSVDRGRALLDALATTRQNLAGNAAVQLALEELFLSA